MKLFIAVLLLCGIHAVCSCSCVPWPGVQHPQNFFCSNDAVFIGKVKMITKPVEQDEYIIYIIEVKRSFRGNCKGNITVTSVNSVAACGITYLKKGKTYLLTAKNGENGTYSIAACTSRVIEKKNISNQQRNFPGRTKSTVINIQYCGLNGNCGIVAPPPNTCTYFGDSTKVKCYNKLRCIPKTSGDGCRWSAFNCGGPGGITNG